MITYGKLADQFHRVEWGQEAANMWVERMSCEGATIEEMPPVEGEYTVQLEHYPNCDGGAEISLYYVDGMTGGGWWVVHPNKPVCSQARRPVRRPAIAGS
jgi:hypothetical protein